MSEPIKVPHALSGERLDRVVALVAGCSRATASQAVRSGAVRVGGQVERHGARRLQLGERLELDPSIADPVEAPAAPQLTVSFGVVYEDSALVVVDKPAGLVVHRGAGRETETLVGGLLARYPDIGGIGDPTRPGIVHRLDRETSGLLVVARSMKAYEKLTEQLSTRTMGRTYRTVVLDAMEADEGTIEAPIGRSLRHPTRMAIRAGGKAARTHYKVRARRDFPLPTTELEVKLETGRTHQIRVHLQAIGHPVAGDSTYGGSTNLLGLQRPFLHAESLHVVHPESGEELTFTSPLPDDLVAALAALGNAQAAG